MNNLREKHCATNESEIQPVQGNMVFDYLLKLSPGWKVEENKTLVNSYSFENFKHGMAFTQEVGLLAENENHHPNIYLEYGKVTIELSTHSVNGLSENDFIMAAKIDSI